MPQSRNENDGSAKNAAVDAVISQYLEDVERGLRLEQSHYIQMAPELAPELQSAFRRIRLIEDAADRTVERKLSAGVITFRARCPFCHECIDDEIDETVQGIRCQVCGEKFVVVNVQSGRVPDIDSERYELIEVIGSGGFGTVWKAFDNRIQRTVAIKVPHCSHAAVAETLAEARVAGRLAHENIVAIHDVSEAGNFIVCDFIEGNTLAEVMSQRRLAQSEFLDIGMQIANALHYAHEHGIIHRDLKPHNIMVDNDGKAYVMDFGLALNLDSVHVTISRSTQVVGTLRYMSPEQADGDSQLADRRSDIYSLGVILFEMLTGEPPFRGNMSTLLRKKKWEDPPSLRSLDSRIPKDLETVTLHCLQREPANRYQTALELREELERVRDGKPVIAKPVTRLERTWRWCRRHPAIASLATALIVVLVVAAQQYGMRQAEEYHSKIANAWSQIYRGAEGSRRKTISTIKDLRDHPVANENQLRDLMVASLGIGIDSVSEAITIETPPEAKSLCFLDESSLAIGYGDGAVRIFDAETGVETGMVTPHDDIVKAVHASKANGKIRLLSIGKDGRVFESVKTGTEWSSKQTATVLLGPNQASIWSAQFTPSGEFVAVVIGTKETEFLTNGAAVWRTSDWEQTISVSKPSGIDDLRSSAVSSSGRYLATSFSEKDTTGFFVWAADDAQPKRKIVVCKGDTYPDGICFQGESDTIVFGAAQPCIYEMGGQPRYVDLDYAEAQCAAAGHDGIIAFTKTRGEVKLLDSASGVGLGNFDNEFTKGRTGLAMSRKGTKLAAYNPARVRIWTLERFTERVNFAGHSAGTIKSLAFHPRNPQVLLSAASDNTIRFWDVGTGLSIRPPMRLENEVKSLAFHPDGEMLACGTGGGTNIFRWKNGELTKLFVLDKAKADYVTFDPEGKFLAACGTGTGTGIHVWRLRAEDNPAFELCYQVEDGEFPHVVFGPASHQLTWVGLPSWTQIGIIDLESGMKLETASQLKVADDLSLKYPGWLGVAVRSETEELIFVDSDSGSAMMWQRDKDRRHHLGAAGRFRESRVVISPDGELLAALEYPTQVALWNLSTRKRIVALKEEGHRVMAMSWSPDSRKLAIGLANGGLHVWRVEKVREQLAKVRLDWK